MMYKEFNVEIAKTLAARITISDDDMIAAGFFSTADVVEKFKEINPQYKDCSYTKEISEDVWTLSLWTTSGIVFKEK